MGSRQQAEARFFIAINIQKNGKHYRRQRPEFEPMTLGTLTKKLSLPDTRCFERHSANSVRLRLLAWMHTPSHMSLQLTHAIRTYATVSLLCLVAWVHRYNENTTTKTKSSQILTFSPSI